MSIFESGHGRCEAEVASAQKRTDQKKEKLLADTPENSYLRKVEYDEALGEEMIITEQVFDRQKKVRGQN